MCRATSIHVVSESAADAEVDPQADYVVTHEVYQVQSAKGIYVDLNIGPTSSSPSSKHFRFQVDSGCSCNTIHVNDLNQLPPIRIKPSMVRLLDYSKSIIPTRGQFTLHCTRRGMSYDIVAQVITSQQYYAPLLGLADSTRMGILKYDVDTANTLLTVPVLPPPPPGELTFDYIRSAYANLFEGLSTLTSDQYKPLPTVMLPLNFPLSKRPYTNLLTRDS